MARHRTSMDSNSSSTSTSPEREIDDDNDSIMEHRNDSQSSLSVSLEEMEIDSLDYERQQQESPITRLPAELLITIFSKLSTPKDFQSCMLVCKAWSRNCVDLLWHRPSTNHWANLLSVIKTVRKQDGFFAYHDLVKRLNLGQLKDEVSDGTLQPLQVCKRVERLTLPGCGQLTDLSLMPVIDGNRSLMAIDVSDLELITDRSLHIIAKNCYRLQGLNISNCKSVTDDSLVEVAKNCRRLKRLKLNDCNQLTDLSIFAFADNCHDILEIDLFKCSHVTDLAVTALIKEGNQLRELRLAQCFRVTDEAFLQLPTDHSYEALRILDLTDCNELQDAGLTKIVQAAPRLRNLVLAKCRNITDRGVTAITRLGKNLHFLHLGHCANITDIGVIQLVRHCNRIRYIDFSCCAKLTDDSVQLLATLPKLKRIGLVKCNNITDNSIYALARPKASSTGTCCHPNNLERLHLSYCTHLSIEGIRTLLVNCPHLTHLSLTGVPPFLRDDILRYCREAPPEFNDHQRDVFCVFSGTKVDELRNFLKTIIPSPASTPSGLDDESPGAGFVGPSSAPASGRFFNWGPPPPPGLWTPNQTPASLAPPRPYGTTFNTVLPQVPHLPIQTHTPLAQSAPSQAQPFVPPPLFAGRPRSPNHSNANARPANAAAGMPGSSRGSLQPGHASANQQVFTLPPVRPHQPFAPPHQQPGPSNGGGRGHTQGPSASRSAQNPNETPMAFPPTPHDDDHGGVDL